MSLILEALNKADRERDEQTPVPHLQTVHGRIAAPTPTKKPLGLYFVIALLIVILCLLLALLFKQFNSAAPAASGSNQPTTAPAGTPTTQPTAAFTPPPPPTPVPAAAVNAEVQEIYQDVHSPAPASGQDVETLYNDEPIAPKKITRSKSRLLDDLEAEASALDAAQTAESEALAGAATPKRSEKVTESAKPAPTEAELDAEMVKRLWEETKKEIPDAPVNPNKVTTQINAAVQNTLAAYKEIPYLHELPESFQSTVPSINYNNHVYSDKGGAVVINKKTLKVGQEISPGLVIDRVVSDGVVLQFKGKRFKLNALSSWVNI